MQFINKSTTILFLITVTLTSCNSFASTLATASSTVVMETTTPIVKATITETQAAISSVTPTVSPDTPTPYKQPTLIPTIETAKIPDLLNNSLSIETLNAFNGYNSQRITGWSNGFNGGMWNRGSRDRSQGYLWMDSSHLLLFPATGETTQPNWSTITSRPVVMNINSGKIWLPPTDRSLNEGRWFNIVLPQWSSKLQILVTGENVGQKEGASTFTADGKRISHYEGELIDISPSAERIFVIGDTWIDLASGKTVNFGWGSGFGYEVYRWFPIWSRDESQIYFCCYYYGNANTGQSYTIKDEDTIFDGKPFTNPHGLGHAYGEWLNDHTIMAQYDAWWYEGPGFTAIFDVLEITYHNLGTVAGLPDAFNDYHYTYKSISPNGDYMYVSPGAQSEKDPQIYLVDLKTLKSTLYHAYSIDWSTNGKYGVVHRPTDSQVLTLSDKTLRILPAQTDFQKPLYWVANAWHPTEGVSVSIFVDNQNHLVVKLLDVETLTYREKKFDLPANFNKKYSISTNMVWNSRGDQFALVAPDNSIWALDYPKLEHLEQLTSSMANIKGMSWSPDGRYLSYSSGTDIYIINTESKP